MDEERQKMKCKWKAKAQGKENEKTWKNMGPGNSGSIQTGQLSNLCIICLLFHTLTPSGTINYFYVYFPFKKTDSQEVIYIKLLKHSNNYPRKVT